MTSRMRAYQTPESVDGCKRTRAQDKPTQFLSSKWRIDIQNKIDFWSFFFSTYAKFSKTDYHFQN